MALMKAKDQQFLNDFQEIDIYKYHGGLIGCFEKLSWKSAGIIHNWSTCKVKFSNTIGPC